jgi:lipoprotein-anchoring transpeptidase ErfK/SrfK
MYVHEKIGGGAKPGTVFKSRRPTGEVVKPNAPGRDPIVSRILWLEGQERANANTKERMIYIHGTPEERNIGRPASYGCIRMKSKDVIDLYDRVGVGTGVVVKASR